MSKDPAWTIRFVGRVVRVMWRSPVSSQVVSSASRSASEFRTYLFDQPDVNLLGSLREFSHTSSWSSGSHRLYNDSGGVKVPSLTSYSHPQTSPWLELMCQSDRVVGNVTILHYMSFGRCFYPQRLKSSAFDTEGQLRGSVSCPGTLRLADGEDWGLNRNKSSSSCVGTWERVSFYISSPIQIYIWLQSRWIGAWRHTHNSSQNMSLRPLHWAVVRGRVSTEPGKQMPLRSIG